MTLKRAITALALVGTLSLAAPAMAKEAERAASPPQPQPQQGGGLASAPDNYKRAGEILRQMLPADIATSMASAKPTTGFGSEMSRLAFENAYVQLWARPGLTLKERSLVTIAILIALGNEHELAVHLASGLRNGLTPQELEEVIYQSTAYAGFPKASDALAVAKTVMAKEGK